VKKISFLFAAALIVSLAAGPALASNTGFKLNYPMLTGNNFLSVPFFYFPDGNVNNPTQNTVDTCNDLGVDGGGDCTVTSITHFTTSGPQAYSCGSPIGFYDLTVGEGLVVNVGGDCTANIVGSHDDNYSLNKGSSLLSLMTGNNLMSVPYHVMANDSSELCDAINNNFGSGTDLSTVTHFTALGPQAYSCGSPIGMYDLVPGEGMWFTAVADFDFQYETY
jgi:hypothetical protein